MHIGIAAIGYSLPLFLFELFRGNESSPPSFLVLKSDNVLNGLMYNVLPQNVLPIGFAKNVFTKMNQTSSKAKILRALSELTSIASSYYGENLNGTPYSNTLGIYIYIYIYNTVKVKLI